MPPKRVLMLDDGRLLADGVGRLLGSQRNIELFVVDSGDRRFLSKVKEARVDVIVVPSLDTRKSLLGIAKILRENPGARVISCGFDRDEINIYRSEPAVGASFEALLSVIQEER